MFRFKLAYRVFAFTMALLMFISSAGFSMDMHFCGGKLKTFSLLGKAKTCQDMADSKLQQSCVHKSNLAKQEKNESIHKKACCAHKTLHCQSSEIGEIGKTEFTLSQSLQLFLKAYTITFISKSTFAKSAPSFNKYRPPLILKDIPVLIQSFLL